MKPLDRYGIEWTGPQSPIAVPMEDGYWTPAHIAEERIERTEARVDELEEKIKQLMIDLDEATVTIKKLKTEMRGSIAPLRGRETIGRDWSKLNEDEWKWIGGTGSSGGAAGASGGGNDWGSGGGASAGGGTGTATVTLNKRDYYAEHLWEGSKYHGLDGPTPSLGPSSSPSPSHANDENDWE